MAKVVAQEKPPRYLIPTEEERRSNPFGGKISNPDTSTPAVSTRPTGQGRTTLNNREALNHYYGTEDAKRIAQLPGMTEADRDVVTIVDRERLGGRDASGMYSQDGDVIRLKFLPVDPYSDLVATHELSHQLFDTQGDLMMDKHQSVLDNMPEKLRQQLGDKPMSELAAELLTEVRMGIQPTPDADLKVMEVLQKYMKRAGSLEGAIDLMTAEGVDAESIRTRMKKVLPGGDIYVQRSTIHPALHPAGIDRGVDDLIQSLASKPEETLPVKAARVALKYKPMRDYFKWLFSTYGANEVTDTGSRYEIGGTA